MSFAFVFGWSIALVILGASIGILYKLWVYGSRGVFLLFSPVIFLAIAVLFPLIMWNLIIFHFDKVEGKINEVRKEKDSENWEPLKVSLKTRVMLACRATIFVIQHIPLFSGYAAKSIGQRQIEKKVSNLFIPNIIQIIFASGLKDEKMWRRYV